MKVHIGLPLARSGVVSSPEKLRRVQVVVDEKHEEMLATNQRLQRNAQEMKLRVNTSFS